MSAPPRIGLFGTFDIEHYGNLLIPRLFEREMRERLPDAQIRAFSPYGPDHPVGSNDGWSPEPIGLWTRERLRELAAELDLVVVAGGDIVHARDERLATAYGVDPLELRLRRPSDFFLEYPAVWHAVGVPFDLDPHEARVVRSVPRPYVAVRDERSRVRLAAAGVEAGVVVVPDPAFALDRLFPAASLGAVRGRLRAREAYPAKGAPLVLEGGGERAAALATAAGDRTVVLLEPEDGVAEAMSSRPAGRVYRLERAASLEEMAAAISGAAGYVGSSVASAITALVHGVPTLLLDLAGRDDSELAGLAALVGREDIRVTQVPPVLAPPPAPDIAPLQTRVAEHYDRIAAHAGDHRPVPEPAAPPAPFELTRRRLLEERRRYADLVEDVATERDQARAELTEAKRYIASLEEHLGVKDRQLREAYRALSEPPEPGAPGRRSRFGFLGRGSR